LRPLLPRMGITRLANVTGLDHIGIPVVMACRPNSRSLAVSQGKGMDLDSAKVSAAMESVESYHAERVALPLQFATYRELRARHSVIDVELLRRPIDSHFHSDYPILWVEGEDLIGHRKILAPYQLVHSAYTKEWAFDLNCFAADSTGLASGNHLLEAASHAICEAVERDASAHWDQIPEPEREARRVDLNTVDDPLCRQALDLFTRAGVAVSVDDITNSVGIAAYDCQIADREANPLRTISAARGSGCHPVRGIALLRALTEAAQSRLTIIAGSRDDMPWDAYRRWLDPEVLAEQRQWITRPGFRPFTAAPTFESDSFEADVAWELDRVREAGFSQVILIDLTREEFALPVVRVRIPGMERPAPSPEIYGSCGRSPEERRP
ncbi:MAG: YcaO-like family protein, partial [Desulfobacterales bacterium]|nr:YcaO-like family protein [Desulfobacterales bacterium]